MALNFSEPYALGLEHRTGLPGLTPVCHFSSSVVYFYGAIGMFLKRALSVCRKSTFVSLQSWEITAFCQKANGRGHWSVFTKASCKFNLYKL